MLGIEPKSGNLIDDTIEGQTQQSLENLKTVLEYKRNKIEKINQN